ncbi:MAG: hypothetical protein RR844_08495 [Clostridium sp.]
MRNNKLKGIIECYNTYDQDDIYFNIAELILKDYRQLRVSKEVCGKEISNEDIQDVIKVYNDSRRARREFV